MHPRLGQRTLVAVLVAVCALSATGVALAGSTAELDDELTVTAAVDDETVWVGETIDLTVTVENSGEEFYDIEEIAVVDSDGEVFAEEDIRSVRVEPDETEELVLADIEVDRPGVAELAATVDAADRTGRVAGTVQATTEVIAEQPDPVLELGAEQAVDGAERALSLTLGNPHDEPIDRIDASLATPADSNVTLVDGSGSLTSLEPGETREVEFTARGGATGAQAFELSLEFETPDGEFWERTYPVSAEFLEPAGSAGVDVAEVSVSATPNGVRVNGSLFTPGNVTVEDVVVEPADETGIGPARPDPQAYLSVIDDGTASFALTAELDDDRERLPLRVEYRTDGVERETTVEVPYTGPRRVTPVQLTDTSVTGGATPTVGGEVANVRDSEVSGVTVRIADQEGVSPGTPGEFFAGSIEAGQFTPMEPISAELTDDRETVPVEITYVYEGVQYSTVEEIEADSADPAGTTDDHQEQAELPEFDPGTDDDERSVPGGALAVGAGIVVLVALALGAVVYRRR